MISLEYLSSNAHVAYPLDDKQQIPDIIEGILVDAKITIPSVMHTFSFYLDKVYIIQDENSSEHLNLQLVIRYSDIDGSRHGYITLEDQLKVDTYYKVVHYSDTKSDIPELQIMLVVSIEECVFALNSTTDKSFIYENLNLKFSESALEISPKHVQTITLYNFTDPDDRTIPTSETVIDGGDVVIKPGYNIELDDTGITALFHLGILDENLNLEIDDYTSDIIASKALVSQDDTLGNTSQSITISAIPGSGKGKVPCTDKISLVAEQLRSDKGNVLIKNNTCYDLVPDDKYGDLRIINKCVACCQCNSYVDAVNRLHEVEGVLKSLNSALLKIMAGTYTEAANNFNQSIDELKSDPVRKYNIQITGRRSVSSSKLGGSNIRGSLVRLGFVCTINNPTREPIYVSGLKFKCEGKGQLTPVPTKSDSSTEDTVELSQEEALKYIELYNRVYKVCINGAQLSPDDLPKDITGRYIDTCALLKLFLDVYSYKFKGQLPSHNTNLDAQLLEARSLLKFAVDSALDGDCYSKTQIDRIIAPTRKPGGIIVREPCDLTVSIYKFYTFEELYVAAGKSLPGETSSNIVPETDDTGLNGGAVRIHKCSLASGSETFTNTADAVVSSNSYIDIDDVSEEITTAILPNKMILPHKSLSFTVAFKDDTLVSNGHVLDGITYQGDFVISIKEQSGQEYVITKTAIINKIK